MTHILTRSVGRACHILCCLAVVALVLAGGAFTHLQGAELGNHTHNGAFALSEKQQHDHASPDENRRFDRFAIHCGSDILDLSYRERPATSCGTARAIVLAEDKDAPATPLIEPPPPRTRTFAL